MPYTMEDFQREYRAARFNELTLEERQKLLKQVSLEEVMAVFSPEVVESYLQRLKRESTSPKPKKKK